MGIASPARAQDPAEVNARLTQAMGGADAWNGARYLEFHFVVERDGKATADIAHAWDRWSGDYRVSATTRDGVDYLVLFNLNTRQGTVRLDGEVAKGEDAAEYLDMAYGRFINDTYWLLMPWKWMDPGVTLTPAGQETIDGAVCDVVELSFKDEIGLTSSDHYWGYVSRDTGLMVRWGFVLEDEEGNPGTGDRSLFTWEDWQDVGGGLKLSLRKPLVDEDGAKFAVVFTHVRAAAEVPADMMTP